MFGDPHQAPPRRANEVYTRKVSHRLGNGQTEEVDFGAGNFSGLATNRALRPIYCKRRFWFRTNVPLEGDCYAHVLIVTRRVTGVYGAHYKNVFIVSHASLVASAHKNT